MIPYIELPPISIGPVQLQPFGTLVAIGIAVGTYITFRQAKEYGLERKMVRRAILWVLLGGFFTTHVTVVLFYHPDRIVSDPWSLLRVSEGMYSIGGFFGGLGSLYLFSRIYKQPLTHYTDAMALGMLAAWIFGRSACTIAHDHPGVHSDFILAVAYPDGSRHDLGFYELLYTILLFILFEFIRRRPMIPGRIALWIGIAYAPVRFLLDFLRAYDPRYFFLTPGQYGSIALFGMCLLLFPRTRLRNHTQ